MDALLEDVERVGAGRHVAVRVGGGAFTVCAACDVRLAHSGRHDDYRREAEKKSFRARQTRPAATEKEEREAAAHRHAGRAEELLARESRLLVVVFRSQNAFPAKVRQIRVQNG